MAVDALGPSPSNAGPPPSSEIRLGKAKLDKKRGSAKLAVKVAGPGKVKLAKTGSVKGDHERAKQSGKLKLSVTPRGKVKRLNKKNKANVEAKVTFDPECGASDTKRKKIPLVKR